MCKAVKVSIKPKKKKLHLNMQMERIIQFNANYQCKKCKRQWSCTNQIRNRPALCARCGQPSYPIGERTQSYYHIPRYRSITQLLKKEPKVTFLLFFSCLFSKITRSHSKSFSIILFSVSELQFNFRWKTIFTKKGKKNERDTISKTKPIMTAS